MNSTWCLTSQGITPPKQVELYFPQYTEHCHKTTKYALNYNSFLISRDEWAAHIAPCPCPCNYSAAPSIWTYGYDSIKLCLFSPQHRNIESPRAGSNASDTIYLHRLPASQYPIGKFALVLVMGLFVVLKVV